jgi:hypothetical protein
MLGPIGELASIWHNPCMESVGSEGAGAGFVSAAGAETSSAAGRDRKDSVEGPFTDEPLLVWGERKLSRGGRPLSATAAKTHEAPATKVAGALQGFNTREMKNDK